MDDRHDILGIKNEMWNAVEGRDLCDVLGGALALVAEIVRAVPGIRDATEGGEETVG